MSYPVPPQNLLHLVMDNEAKRRELQERDRKLRRAWRNGLEVWCLPADNHAVLEPQ